MLGVNGATNSKGRVELYEKGYGKDAAGIAKEAISYGKKFSCSNCIFNSRIRTQAKTTTLTLS
jgi:signal recognition particle receptor subunit alpha